MKLYELTYLLPLDLPELEVKSLQEKINSFIIDAQGALDRIEDITKKRLGNKTSAQMGGLNFYIGPEKIADLEKKLKSESQIIRHMILHKKPRKTEHLRRMRKTAPLAAGDSAKIIEKTSLPAGRPKKVEIKEIEKKLEEILGE